MYDIIHSNSCLQDVFKLFPVSHQLLKSRGKRFLFLFPLIINLSFCFQVRTESPRSQQKEINKKCPQSAVCFSYISMHAHTHAHGRTHTHAHACARMHTHTRGSKILPFYNTDFEFYETHNSAFYRIICYTHTMMFPFLKHRWDYNDPN